MAGASAFEVVVLVLPVATEAAQRGEQRRVVRHELGRLLAGRPNGPRCPTMLWSMITLIVDWRCRTSGHGGSSNSFDGNGYSQRKKRPERCCARATRPQNRPCGVAAL